MPVSERETLRRIAIGDTATRVEPLVEPKLVGVVSDPDALARFAAEPQPRPVDWIEVRFDQFPRSDWARAYPSVDALEASGTTVLATIRIRSDGGAWEHDDDSRLAAFEEVLAHASVIDVEVDSVQARRVVELAHACGRRVVVSHHDFARTPSLEVLRDVDARSRALGADVVKISTMIADGARDHHALLGLLAEHRDGTLCVLGMGPDGIALRAYAPTVGSVLAYAYVDRSTAPGQLSAAELGAFFRMVGLRR